MNVRVHLIVHGVVQGVFYRASAMTQALARGLTGWVANCNDGTVEIVCEGEPSAVDSFIRWCREGPDSAEVSDIDVNRSDATGEFTMFTIR